MPNSSDFPIIIQKLMKRWWRSFSQKAFRRYNTEDTVSNTVSNTRLSSLNSLIQMQPHPERGGRVEGFPAAGQGWDGEEGDRAHGLWRPEDHLCGVPWLYRWTWAQLGRWEQHPEWPHGHLRGGDRGPRPARGGWSNRALMTYLRGDAAAWYSITVFMRSLLLHFFILRFLLSKGFYYSPNSLVGCCDSVTSILVPF